MEPTISVLMPVRDGVRTVNRALDSSFKQTLSDFEIVVINDHSQDQTEKVLEQYSDNRLRVLPASGSGLVDALNQGLLACKAPYVARLDADD